MTVEVAHDDRRIASLLHEQSEDTTNPQLAAHVQEIIDLYRQGVRQSDESEAIAAKARIAVLPLYLAWRYQFAEAVGPIALQLGHPAPAPVADGPVLGMAPVAVKAADLFAKHPPASAEGPVAPPAPGADSEALEASDATETTSEPQTPSATQPAASNGGKRARRSWAQSDVVALTRLFMTAIEGSDPMVLSQQFAETYREDLGAQEVFSKAVELELTPAPPAAPKYEMSATDKRVIEKRVCEQLVLVDNPEIKLTQLRYAAGVLRELIKSLAG
jgi:hypothetical protein